MFSLVKYRKSSHHGLLKFVKLQMLRLQDLKMIQTMVKSGFSRHHGFLESRRIRLLDFVKLLML